MNPYKCFFCVFAILLLPSYGFTQTKANAKTLDSLHNIVNKANDTQEKVTSLLALCSYYKKYSTRNYDSLSHYAHKVLKLTQSKNTLQKRRIDALDHLAFKHLELEEVDSAKVFIDEIKEIAERLDYGIGLSLLNFRYSGISYLENDVNMHIYHLENAYSIAKSYKIPKHIIFDRAVDLSSWYITYQYSTDITTKVLYEVLDFIDDPNISLESKGIFYLNLGLTYDYSNDYKKSIPYYEKSVAIFYKNNNTNYLYAPLINIANYYEFVENYKEAIKFHEKALALQIEGSYANIYYGLALCNFYLKDYDNSESFYRSALSEYQEAEDLYGEGDCLMGLGRIYLEKQNSNQSNTYFDVAKKRYLQHIEKQTMNGIKSPEITNAHLRISEIYEYQKKYKKSLEHYKLYSKNDKLINDEQNLKVTERFNFFKNTVTKNKEIESLENQNKIQELRNEKDNNIKMALLFFLILIVTLLAVVFNRYRLKQKAFKIIREKNAENKLLIQEIHHRVKNNLQIILSLLGAQINKNSDNEDLKAILKESQNKIKSMAIIHQNMYNNNQFSQVAVSPYIKELIVHIQKSFEKNKDHVKLNFNILEEQIPMTLAVPLGLIVNELVTNAFKHAFTNENNIDNTISITFQKVENTSRYRLIIQDNGKGLATDYKMDNSTSFGLQLVNGLVSQLHGDIEITKNKGASFNITLEKTNT